MPLLVRMAFLTFCHDMIHAMHICLCMRHYIVGVNQNPQQPPVSSRAAQSEAEKLRSQVDKLQRENQMLRARLGEDPAEPDHIATPRKFLVNLHYCTSPSMAMNCHHIAGTSPADMSASNTLSLSTAGMRMLGEQDTAGDASTVDAKQRGAASSEDPMTPVKSSDNDQESNDKGQPSQVAVTGPSHPSRASKQRTTAIKRTAK